MISKAEFEQKFNQEFKKEKDLFKKNQAFSIVWLVLATILVVGACVGLHFLFDPENENWIIYVFVGILAWFVIAAIPVLSRKDKFIKAYKKFDLGRLLSIIYGDKVFYMQNGCIQRDLFIKSRFTDNDFNNYSGEDLFAVEIKGRFKGEETTTHLVASDIKATKTVKNSDGTKTEKEVFDGIFCDIQFRKPFKCTLELNSTKKTELKPLETESGEFNKAFRAQTDDQIEARLILTLPLMDKLLTYANNTKAKLGFAFREEHLFIYIKKELFELSKKDDSFNFKLVEPIYDDIALFDGLVEEIEGNRKIFKI